MNAQFLVPRRCDGHRRRDDDVFSLPWHQALTQYARVQPPSLETCQTCIYFVELIWTYNSLPRNFLLWLTEKIIAVF